MIPSFKFSDGGATTKTIQKLLDGIQTNFGAVTPERIVDLCVCTVYAFRETPKWTIKQLMSPTGIKRLKEKERGSYFYEDRWLSKANLTRGQLVDMIKDRSQHPQAKFIYMASEEPTKLRLHNTEVGFTLCNMATLGWSPLSQACSTCKYVSDCQRETERKYPELFRLRLTHGQTD